TMSVTRFGVSLLNVVATIDRPASHHGTARPEAKNSVVLRPARRPKNSAGAKHRRSDARTTTQSSAPRCMRADHIGTSGTTGATGTTGTRWRHGTRGATCSTALRGIDAERRIKARKMRPRFQAVTSYLSYSSYPS